VCVGREEQARGGETEAAEMAGGEPKRAAPAHDRCDPRLCGQRGWRQRRQTGLCWRQQPRTAPETKVLAAGCTGDAVG